MSGSTWMTEPLDYVTPRHMGSVKQMGSVKLGLGQTGRERVMGSSHEYTDHSW